MPYERLRDVGLLSIEKRWFAGRSTRSPPLSKRMLLKIHQGPSSGAGQEEKQWSQAATVLSG